MSPEQLKGEKNIACQTDIYSLGVILYQILTKKYPFTGKTVTELYHNILETQPSMNHSNIVSSLQAICLKALEKNPKFRYRTAFDMAQDIQCFLQKKPTQAEKFNFYKTASKLWPKIRNWAYVTGILFVMATAYNFYFSPKKQNAKNKAKTLQQVEQTFQQAKDAFEKKEWHKAYKALTQLVIPHKNLSRF
jgi:serine/threonine protein kinase